MYFGKTAGVVGASLARGCRESPPAHTHVFFLFIINTALARTELKATVAVSLSSILPKNNDDDAGEEEQEARVEDET